MPELTHESRVIPITCSGLRLDCALARVFPEYSRAQLTSWFKNGRLIISPTYKKPKDTVRGGEQVVLQDMHVMSTNAHDTPLAEAIELTIVYEDTHCLVINKPAGLIAHPGAGNPTHTLVNALIYHDANLQHLPRAGLIHRLDKDTTGLLIIAKTPSAYTTLVRQMQARAITREYDALVHGHLISGGRIETGYGRCPQQRLKMAVLPNGRPAITLFSVTTHGLGSTLLKVSLLTGRTHQIRVHMAHIKHPIIGDPIYGGRSRCPQGLDETQRQLFTEFKRQALHASRLGFYHPVTQEYLTLTAPLPDDFKLLLDTLTN